MRHEHDEHAEHLKALSELTGRFTPPEGACRSWRALYDGCAKLAADLEAHIALENDVLFPAYEKF
ncbi:MAG TPA: hemerythrin domain-containing protein [Vitreimonas sp.]|uniref:hemerythrin domain-containing protein n=1 Tax=Vitreimonas sp. TaxID=3069702 RepID=UPI002D5D81BB|nr:hemerythrin domain-containing protein [Vitreimonas sp.]HYD89847.1 hemerythrin domain-containing protein [Vitreimonas sp.]